jgi:hypothetical protein
MVDNEAYLGLFSFLVYSTRYISILYMVYVSIEHDGLAMWYIVKVVLKSRS